MGTSADDRVLVSINDFDLLNIRQMRDIQLKIQRENQQTLDIVALRRCLQYLYSQRWIVLDADSELAIDASWNARPIVRLK